MACNCPVSQGMIGNHSEWCAYERDKFLRSLPAAPAQPVAWIQPDHLAHARKAPFLCRVEPKQRDDFVPIYTLPPVAPAQDVGERLATWATRINSNPFKQTCADVQAELTRLRAAIDAAFDTLSMYGVPKLRARSAANGIRVLVTRMDKELAAANARADAAEKDLRQMLSEHHYHHYHGCAFDDDKPCDCFIGPMHADISKRIGFVYQEDAP